MRNDSDMDQVEVSFGQDDVGLGNKEGVGGAKSWGWEEPRNERTAVKTTNKRELYSLGPEDQNLLGTTSDKEKFACQGKFGYKKAN